MRKREGASLERAHISEKKLRPATLESSTDHVEEEEEEEESTSLWLFMRLFIGVPGPHQIYVANIRRGGGHTLTRIEDPNWGDEAVGHAYAAAGSTIYKIGGDIKPGALHYPKDVFFSNAVTLKGDTITWEKGPSLIAGKPYPLVVNVNGKIYALAGLTDGYDDEGKWTEIPDPVFEVLDPLGDGPKWEALPNPPFMSFYTGDGPRYASHTVIGSTIYMNVRHRLKGTFNSLMYSYDTDSKIWEWHNDCMDMDMDMDMDMGMDMSPDDKLIPDNLRLCYWDSRADVVGNKLYLCYFTNWLGELANLSRQPLSQGDKVFAIDLAAKRERVDYYCDEYHFCHYNLVPLPVHGLKFVMDSLPDNMWTSGFITHLARNMFCFVALFRQTKDYFRLCTFEVSENEAGSSDENPPPGCSLWAHDVDYKDYELPEQTETMSYEWCKVLSPRLSC